MGLFICLFLSCHFRFRELSCPQLSLSPNILQLFVNGIALLIFFPLKLIIDIQKNKILLLTECISFNSFRFSYVQNPIICIQDQLLLFFLIYCVCMHMCATTHMWRTENNFQTQFLSCFVSPGDQTWAIRLSVCTVFMCFIYFYSNLSTNLM